MITSRTTDLHYSYFRFFLEQLQNLKYEVYYEMDKKTLKIKGSLNTRIIHTLYSL